MPYAQELPTLGSSDVLGSYRGGGTGSAYAFPPANKTYYPAMHAYSSAYGDEFEFGLGVPSPAVMNPEPTSMLPGGHWSSGARAKPHSFSSIYLDTEGTYSSYGSTSLLHRSSNSVNSDATNFSFSGVAASLPLSSTPGPDRLLPNPAGRSSTLPYPAVKPTPPASSSTTSTLADVATAASYAGGFGAPGLSFSSTASSSLPSHPSSSSARSTSDTYAGSEVIFSEQERSLHSQGAAFDMSAYTSSTHRGSMGGDSGGGAHTYVPGESTHETAGHHHSSQHHLSASYLSNGTSSPIVHRHGLPLASGSGSTGHAAHTDDRHVAVSSRH